MTNLSKEYVFRNITNITNCNVWHPWTDSCVEALLKFAFQTVLGSSTFFLPIYVLKIALNWKKLNRKYLRAQLVAYFKTQCYAVTYLSMTIGSICLTVNMGKIHYYMLMVSGALGGLSILIESEENCAINTILYFNQVLEAALNYAAGEKFITRTRLNETVVFMVVSSVLMYLFRTQQTSRKITSLWFYPVPSLNRHKYIRNGDAAAARCQHKDSCLQHSYKEALKYFGMGYLVEVIKTVIPRFFQTLTSPTRLRRLLFNRKNVLSGLVFGGYVGIYRYVSCCLSKTDGREVAAHALIAGFLAGCTYYLRPNIQIAIIGVTTALQLLSRRVIEANKLSEDVPYSLVVFCLASAVLFHFRFIWQDYCPKYTKNMLGIATNNMANEAHQSFLSFLARIELSRVAG